MIVVFLFLRIAQYQAAKFVVGCDADVDVVDVNVFVVKVLLVLCNGIKIRD